MYGLRALAWQYLLGTTNYLAAAILFVLNKQIGREIPDQLTK